MLLMHVHLLCLLLLLLSGLIERLEAAIVNLREARMVHTGGHVLRRLSTAALDLDVGRHLRILHLHLLALLVLLVLLVPDG